MAGLTTRASAHTFRLSSESKTRWFAMNRSKIKRRQPRAARRATGRGAKRFSGSAVFCSWAWNEIGRGLRLSARELEIIRGLYDGHKESAIGAAVSCSARTVETHLRRLHAKLNVHSHMELARVITRCFLQLPLCAAGHVPQICAHREAARCPHLPQSS